MMAVNCDDPMFGWFAYTLVVFIRIESSGEKKRKTQRDGTHFDAIVFSVFTPG